MPQLPEAKKRFLLYILRLVTACVQCYSFGALIWFNVQTWNMYVTQQEACYVDTIYCGYSSQYTTFPPSSSSSWTQTKKLCSNSVAYPGSCSTSYCSSICPEYTTPECCPGGQCQVGGGWQEYDTYCQCENNKNVKVNGVAVCQTDLAWAVGLLTSILGIVVILYLIMIFVIICGCTKTCGVVWRRRMILRFPLTAVITLLVRPDVLTLWSKELAHSHQLDILFIVLQDIPQLVASILVFVGAQTHTRISIASLIGASLSILFGLLRYFFKVHQSFDPENEEKKPLINPTSKPSWGPSPQPSPASSPNQSPAPSPVLSPGPAPQSPSLLPPGPMPQSRPPHQQPYNQPQPAYGNYPPRPNYGVGPSAGPQPGPYRAPQPQYYSGAPQPYGPQPGPYHPHQGQQGHYVAQPGQYAPQQYQQQGHYVAPQSGPHPPNGPYPQAHYSAPQQYQQGQQTSPQPGPFAAPPPAYQKDEPKPPQDTHSPPTEDKIHADKKHEIIEKKEEKQVDSPQNVDSTSSPDVKPEERKQD